MNCFPWTTKPIQMVAAGVLYAIAAWLGACRSENRQAPDRPQLPPKVTLRDVTFYSIALQRDMPYRVVMPSGDTSGRSLRTVYLLHGGGGNFRDWTNYSDVAKYAEHDLILVMPEGNSSYYANAAERTEDRYEDYIVKDLIEEVESKFPAGADVKAGRLWACRWADLGLLISHCVMGNRLRSREGLVRPSMFHRGRFPSGEWNSGAGFEPFLDRGKAGSRKVTIPFCLCDWVDEICGRLHRSSNRGRKKSGSKAAALPKVGVRR